ncbi:metallophosphoesterase family protein [Candidatus Woesearchaeota archaeon]|nr:metallophosphoesterase family protein [Candidatus Woesearchaeota archaeon]
MKLAVISDVHANLEALQAVLADIEAQGINKIYCCGDIVGFGANPGKCIKLLEEKEVISVQGNQDFTVVTLQNIDWYNDEARAVIMWTYKQLWKTEKKYLLKLPVKIIRKRLSIFHGTPKSMYEGVYPDGDLKSLSSMVNTRMLFLGHTHVPFVADVNKVLIVNPGSVGMPFDGNPKASYAVVNTKNLTAGIKRVEYDIKTAAGKIIKAGLPTSIAKRLYKGV